MMDDRDALRQQLKVLEDDVPPMPEGLHQRWMRAVEEEPMDKTPPGKKTSQWKRLLAVAAAAVFVIGGAIWAKDVNLGQSKNSYVLLQEDTATEDTASYSRNSSLLMSTGSTDSSGAGASLYTNNDEGGYGGEDNIASQQETKIIRTVSLTLGTTAFDDTLSSIKQACFDAGGRVEYASEYGSTSQRSASLTLRIPSEQLDLFLEGTNGWGRVIRRSETAEDVTESYYDTKGRLETQQALMARLKELTEKAESLEDILSLESQMADTQYQIDRLTGILQSTDNQVSYATVNVSVQEEKAADTAQNTEESLLSRMGSALKVGADAFVSFLSDALVFLVYALPFLGVVAVVVITVVIVRKKRNK